MKDQVKDSSSVGSKKKSGSRVRCFVGSIILKNWHRQSFQLEVGPILCSRDPSDPSRCDWP